jgi:hypothetical protein
MWRTVGRACLAALVVGSVGLGCQKQAVQQKVPPDPLLTSKKPVEGNPAAAVPQWTVHLEPPAPTVPEMDGPRESPRTVPVKIIKEGN